MDVLIVLPDCLLIVFGRRSFKVKFVGILPSLPINISAEKMGILFPA